MPDRPAWRRRAARAPRWSAFAVAVVAAAAVVAGCSPRVARVINPTASRCQASLRDAFELILVTQEEKPEVAQAVADGAVQALAEVDLGPRAFKVSSPSGVDYAFLFEDEGHRCLLHLAGWQKGIVQYTNNVTYVATRPLRGCKCEK